MCVCILKVFIIINLYVMSQYLIIFNYLTSNMYIFNKITNFFKSNWNDYKYHSLMMDPYFSGTKKWEQFFGLFILLCFFLQLLLQTKNIIRC
jgi:hypothetical protein